MRDPMGRGFKRPAGVLYGAGKSAGARAAATASPARSPGQRQAQRAATPVAAAALKPKSKTSANASAASKPRMRRRIIAVALPHLEAEYQLRRAGLTGTDRPFATAATTAGALRLTSVNQAAAAAGLSPGQGLADARAICPNLSTRPSAPKQLAAFRRTLARWAERFSPLIGHDARDALVIDATGGTHLWGGERAMLAAVAEALAAHGLTTRVAMADSKGAAWALAHCGADPLAIAPPGATHAALADLPVSALRLTPDAVEALASTGLRRIGDMARIPRGQIARRFGLSTLRRLDQALGAEPDPIDPDRPAARFSARLTLPEPIGLLSDLSAGLMRLLERVCEDLEIHQQGARTLRLTAQRTDGADRHATIRLARPMRDAERLATLFAPELERVEAGHGIDALRLVATETEPLKPAQLRPDRADRRPEGERLADLLTRIGNRTGFEAVTRFLPAESHVPERAFTIATAAWSEPAAWPNRTGPRPIALFAPEPVTPLGPVAAPPGRFQWRGQSFTARHAQGPERIAPEWWWDDPAWRTGLRDYWQIATAEGPRIWLFHTPASPRPAWHAHGLFA